VDARGEHNDLDLRGSCAVNGTGILSNRLKGIGHNRLTTDCFFKTARFVAKAQFIANGNGTAARGASVGLGIDNPDEFDLEPVANRDRARGGNNADQRSIVSQAALNGKLNRQAPDVLAVYNRPVRFRRIDLDQIALLKRHRRAVFGRDLVAIESDRSCLSVHVYL